MSESSKPSSGFVAATPSSGLAPAPVPLVEGRCNHFVMRKKRYCRMSVKPGLIYCGEHMQPNNVNSKIKNNEQCKKDSKEQRTEDEEGGNLLRVVCPLDPKHTCYANKLAKHLKICNARQKETPPYISKGINSGNIKEKSIINQNQSQRSLASVSTDKIKTLINKIKSIHSEIIEKNHKITEKYSKHEIVEEEMKKPEYGDKTKKHLIQTSSLIGILNENNLLQNETCYVEFGAGKGHLSFWLSKSLEQSFNNKIQNFCVLLLERAAHRHKADNKLNKSSEEIRKAYRIRADIADLILDKVEIIQESKNVVGITKHLCGEATDLAIRCLANMEKKEKILGLTFAFCCHHRCQWLTYVGKAFFTEQGLTSDDFDTMCGMVSWATCGSGVGREIKSNKTQEEIESIIKQNERYQEIGVNRKEKAEIGQMCKNIMNYGRLKFIEENLQFNCNLHTYVKEEISPENLCLVAYKKVTKDQ